MSNVHIPAAYIPLDRHMPGGQSKDRAHRAIPRVLSRVKVSPHSELKGCISCGLAGRGV